MSFLKQLFGKTSKVENKVSTTYQRPSEEEHYDSEEYNKIVNQYGKSKADEIMKYWIQAYLCYESAAAATDEANADQLQQLVYLIRRELVNAKGPDFAMCVSNIQNICDEAKMAEEINAVDRYKNNKKYHWMKQLNVEY